MREKVNCKIYTLQVVFWNKSSESFETIYIYIYHPCASVWCGAKVTFLLSFYIRQRLNMVPLNVLKHSLPTLFDIRWNLTYYRSKVSHHFWVPIYVMIPINLIYDDIFLSSISPRAFRTARERSAKASDLTESWCLFRN